jgi:hypothetical protein
LNNKRAALSTAFVTHTKKQGQKTLKDFRNSVSYLQADHAVNLPHPAAMAKSLTLGA